jgi:hypothetical protein
VHPRDMARNRIHETLLDRANSEPLVHPAVYPALFQRVTSNPSQSRRRGPHLAEHENIKASTLPPRMHTDRSIEMQCAVFLNQRKRICPLSMMLHELERAQEADENKEDGDGEKQNEGKEDRERARREELG